jgi:hypothetical protein
VLPPAPIGFFSAGAAPGSRLGAKVAPNADRFKREAPREILNIDNVVHCQATSKNAASMSADPAPQGRGVPDGVDELNAPISNGISCP